MNTERLYANPELILNLPQKDFLKTITMMDRIYPETQTNPFSRVSYGFKNRLNNRLHVLADNPMNLSNDKIDKITWLFDRL